MKEIILQELRRVSVVANLDYSEREKIEQLFCMNTEHVLNFTNRSFREFIYEKLQIDIYTRYQGMTKAKAFKAIIADNDNRTVGKLLAELLIYMQVKNLVTSKNRDIYIHCIEISNRLMGKTIYDSNYILNVKGFKPLKPVIDYERLYSDLLILPKLEDTAQSRGMYLAGYLNNLFEVNNLEPNGSIFISGKLIEGSFSLYHENYLLEASWSNAAVKKDQLWKFNQRVKLNPLSTHGIFLSYSELKEDEVNELKKDKEFTIALITIRELQSELKKKTNLKDVIFKKVKEFE